MCLRSEALPVDNRRTSFIILSLGDVLILRKDYFRKNRSTHPSRIDQCVFGHVLWRLSNKHVTLGTMLQNIKFMPVRKAAYKQDQYSNLDQ